MPWINVDGNGCHYTPAPGSTATPEEVADEIRRAIRQGDEMREKRLADMPTEKDALDVLFQAYTRLRELGWNDAIYCPKDGSAFDVIEAGSTGIHTAHYEGAWPKGSWWVRDAGDLWPSRPILFRLAPDGGEAVHGQVVQPIRDEP